MNQSEFLENTIFTDLENLNDGSDAEQTHYFSESDFETLLKRAEHFGLGVYTIAPKLNGKLYDTVHHDAYKKKATDPKWYSKAFLELKARQEGLAYAATYKVSKKLLER